MTSHGRQHVKALTLKVKHIKEEINKNNKFKL
jgi:hypothetical protein